MTTLLRNAACHLGRGVAAALAFTLAACGGGGGSSSTTTTTITPTVTVSVAAAPTSLTLGATSVLTWSSANTSAGSTCTASGAWSGSKATSGSETVTPASVGSNTYTLVCGGVSSSASVTVAAAPVVVTATPTVKLSASPTRTTVGRLIGLVWTTTNQASGASCTASGAWSGTKNLSSAGTGSEIVTASAAGTSTYTLTCGGVASSVNVVVTAAASSLPTVSIAFAPSSITTLETAQLTWSSTNATACTAAGAWSGSQGTSGTLPVQQTTAGTYTYNLTCTGTNGSATAAATLAVTTASSTSNTATLLVDTGPDGAGAINVPFVSVTVCQPGTTVCQTIDHVLVDTGSYGLRLIGPLSVSLAAVNAPSGSPAGECAQFVSGYAWGAVKQADVKIGGETASGVSVHVIGDSTSAFATAPSSCTSTGANLATVAALGANGILGVGLIKQDCGSACANSAIAGTYYSCAGATCTASTMPLASQVSNPAAAFAVNNNGVILVLPSVPSGGATSLTGTLIFGVGTQTNNSLGTETVYKASSSGYFTTTYKGVANARSFIDSGSNGYFFDDSSITSCSSGFFCPSATLSLSAVNAAYDGSTSGTVAFTIENVNTLRNTTAAASIGGNFSSTASTSNFSASGVFDWGLPFFYGRKVFVVYNGSVTSAGTGPYWAY